MKIFRNRTVIGVLCILLALIICFGVTPLADLSMKDSRAFRKEINRICEEVF